MMQTETGPERAQRRAWAHGLDVGAPVRAVIGWGRQSAPHASANFDMLPVNYADNPFPNRVRNPQAGMTPLEFGERLSNYRVQQAVRTHSIGGTKWRPTPRQRRRLDKKARAAAVRHHVADQSARFEVAHREAAHALAMAGDTPAWPAETVTNMATGEQRTEPLAAPVSPQEFAKPQRERSAINPSGFRVVDRRGEHRS